MPRTTSGLLAAIAAFVMWGVLPLYWKQVAFMDSGSIVAQRGVWSLLILLLILLLRRELGSTIRQLRQPGVLAWTFVSSALLAANWLLYVWATLHDRIIEGSLGYYLNPFFNMLFGVIWFGERHNRMQKLAIGVALAGVAIQIPAAGTFPWLSLTLALTFSLYAVVKKRGNLESRTGLTVEALLLAPLALLWLFHKHSDLPSAFGHSWGHALLLAGTGLATTLPLLCFGHAARNIRLTTLGMAQFIGPTLQLIIGWAVYSEPMTLARLLSFALVWVAIAIYASDAMRRRAEAAAQ